MVIGLPGLIRDRFRVGMHPPLRGRKNILAAKTAAKAAAKMFFFVGLAGRYTGKFATRTERHGVHYVGVLLPNLLFGPPCEQLGSTS